MNTCCSNSRTTNDARPLLPKASFFLGDLRDGLPMLNMSAVFLVSNCNYTEKQMGLLFLCFGLAQTICMAPAGYILDYSRHKVTYVVVAALTVSIITVVIPLAANAAVEQNMTLQMLLHAIQGAVSAVLPPAFNGITLGITGQAGLTHQVSRNRMMNHMGTAVLVGISCLTAYYSYPNFEVLFAVAPVAAAAAAYYCCLIPSASIHRDAARGLITESPTMTEYMLADDMAACKLAALEIDSKTPYEPPTAAATTTTTAQLQQQPDDYMRQKKPWTQAFDQHYHHEPQPLNSSTSSKSIVSSTSSTNSMPSFRFGWKDVLTRQKNNSIRVSGAKGAANNNNEPASNNSTPKLKAVTPAQVLANPVLATFTVAMFFFHLANSSVLPLVMQSLALQDPQAGILLSGMCILIAQACMAYIARWCGDLSATTGRKPLVMFGLASLTLRCLLLTALISAEDWFVDNFKGNDSMEEQGTVVLKALILCTQFLDSVGAGILGTLQILVTSDIAGGSGRFSLVLGVTTASMCLGATVSGYLGQAVAQDYGYEWAFTALGVISLIPVALYGLFMPETLPDFKPAQRHRQERLREWWRRKMGKHRADELPPATENTPTTALVVVPGGAAQGHVELV